MYQTVEGIVFDIQRCSMNDGPGIRTTVFLKGCPLSCKWCHNPESHSAHPQLSFREENCSLCGKCAQICNKCHHISNRHFIDFFACNACGRCVSECHTNALKIIGKSISANEVIEIIKKDIKYYRTTGGGLTVSGGEPFMQPDFLSELLHSAKQLGIHTCVETCGYTLTERILDIAPLVDIFLFDYKATSPTNHKFYTGVDNTLILKNFQALYNQNQDIILRCPIIPGYNDTQEHFTGIANIEKQYPNLLGIEIMPYHNLGKDKAHAIGQKYDIECATVDQSTKTHWKNELRICGCSHQICDSF